MSNNHYSVVVSNVGQVFEGPSKAEANEAYEKYCRLSKATQGRYAGEDVTLWEDGQILKEHAGWLTA